MRVLCTCVPGYGHFHPMVPGARALESQGHEVAFATETRFCARVERAGFRAFPAGIGPGVVLERTLALPGGAVSGPEDAWRFGAAMFGGVAAPAKVPDLVATIQAWKPQLVIHEVTDFAGPVAAAHTGVPVAAHGLGPLFPIEFFERGAEAVAPLWREWGLTPGPFGGMFASAYLDICPPSLQSPDLERIGSVVRPVRPVPFDAVPGERLPPWADQLAADRPTVYVTLGTLDNEAPGVIEAAVQGLRDEPVNLVVTVGPNRDPDELGPQPPNVHVERYVPQSLLFPRCHAVVSHGGSGTTLAALGHALPMVVLPQGANQFWNAARCAALGTAVTLLPGEITPDTVRRAVRTVLAVPSYKQRAAALAAEIAAMPGPEEAVPVLASLAAGGAAASP